MRQRRLRLLWGVLPGLLTGLGTAAAGAPQAPPRTPPPHVAWDWTGILGTGQSLSVGAEGRPVLTTEQPYHNLRLSTGDLAWPVDPDDPALTLTPLVEPIGRSAHAYPSAWPTNIDGETYHTAMADELTALVRAAPVPPAPVRVQPGRDFTSVHAEVGESGQGMVFLKKNATPKGVNGRSYRAGLIVTRATARLARAAGKTYGVGAVVVTHGEADAGNPDYEAQLFQLWQDYDADLRAITGQTQPVQMIVSQQNSVSEHSASTQAQWRVGVDHPAAVVCSGPKYQYPYAPDGVHLTSEGYRRLGEKYAQVYYQRVLLGRPWQPLQPLGAARNGAVITVRFHVPAPPLAWDTKFSPPHPTVPAWAAGRGFEVSTAAGAKVAIQSVAISGRSVTITCASDPGPGARVGYAMVGEPDRMAAPYGGTRHWGLLRDSDPFRGSVTGTPQPNYAVAFDLTVP